MPNSAPIKHMMVDTAHPAALMVGLVALALTLILVVIRLRPKPPKGTDAPTDVFSAGRALAVLQDLLAEEQPHPVGSAQNDVVQERLIAHLEALGYEVEIQAAESCREWEGQTHDVAVKNVLTRLPGRVDGPAVALIAHYDSVPPGPGVADDGSNVAALIEIARILKQQVPMRNPIMFVFTDGEEAWMVGAEAFVQEHPWGKEIGVAINLEARGTSGRSLMFETSIDNAWLIDAYARSVPSPESNSLMYEIYRTMPNDTDLTVFKEAGIAGLNFSFIGDGQYYHTAEDNFAHLDLGSVQHQGESVLAVARQLASQDLNARPKGNAVYLSLLGLTTLRWPQAWTLPLVGLAALLLLTCSAALIWQGQTTIGALLWGLLTALLSIVGSMLLGWGLVWLMSKIAGVKAAALPALPTRIALWAGAVCCALLLSAAFGQRAGVWGAGLGTWILWEILALALALTLIGGTSVILVPTLAATLLIALVAWSGIGSLAWARDAILIAGAAFAGTIWLQWAILFEQAVGWAMNPAITLSVGLTMSALLPAMAVTRESALTRTGLTIAAAAIVIASSIVTTIRAGAIRQKANAAKSH
ncbi:MAG: M20/M25/M40 family metallo-hydrolase [Anaerolineae bacterium]|nr:M20/M25/M40 family metallo-hydrolase [Anaerolineae bacterium]